MKIFHFVLITGVAIFFVAAIRTVMLVLNMPADGAVAAPILSIAFNFLTGIAVMLFAIPMMKKEKLPPPTIETPKNDKVKQTEFYKNI